MGKVNKVRKTPLASYYCQDKSFFTKNIFTKKSLKVFVPLQIALEGKEVGWSRVFKVEKKNAGQL